MAPRSTQVDLKAVQDRFVSAWGQMGSAWGISRTMAEAHALFYIVGEPLCTDELMQRLEISRGNASMTLRALADWGLVTRSHKRGDRKEYFVAERDVWAMVRAIVRERMKREVEPVLALLYEIRDLTGDAAGSEEVSTHNARLDDLLGLMTAIDELSRFLVSPQGAGLREAAEMLADRMRESTGDGA